MAKNNQSKRIIKPGYSRFYLVLILVLTSQAALFSQNNAGTFRLGAQLGFGTEIESLGIGLRGDYALTPKFLIGSDFMYYFGDDDFGIEQNWFDLNFNAYYLIELRNPDLMPYVLGGLNFARTSVKCDGALGSICDDFSNTSIGFNLGGGTEFLLGSIALFGELRVTLGDLDQVVLATGVKLPLN